MRSISNGSTPAARAVWTVAWSSSESSQNARAVRVWPSPVSTRRSVASSSIRRGVVAMLARIVGGSSGSARWMAAWRPPVRAVPAQPTICVVRPGSLRRRPRRIRRSQVQPTSAPCHRRRRSVAPWTQVVVVATASPSALARLPPRSPATASQACAAARMSSVMFWMAPGCSRAAASGPVERAHAGARGGWPPDCARPPPASTRLPRLARGHGVTTLPRCAAAPPRASRRSRRCRTPAAPDRPRRPSRAAWPRGSRRSARAESRQSASARLPPMAEPPRRAHGAPRRGSRVRRASGPPGCVSPAQLRAQLADQREHLLVAAHRATLHSDAGTLWERALACGEDGTGRDRHAGADDRARRDVSPGSDLRPRADDGVLDDTAALPHSLARS